MTVADFVGDYFGFHHNFLGVVGVVLIIFPIITAFSFCLFLWKTELPEKVEFVSMYLLIIWIARFFWIEL
jgi:hypothetical protein